MKAPNKKPRPEHVKLKYQVGAILRYDHAAPTKRIAEVLGYHPQTIRRYANTMRKKLGLPPVKRGRPRKEAPSDQTT